MIRIFIWMLIFAAGFYMGYELNFFTAAPKSNNNIPVQVTATTTVSSTTATTQTKPMSETSSSSQLKNPVTIDTTTLSSSQKALLSMLGVDSEKVTITPAMVDCAYTTLGEVRVAEIIAGSKPGPLEIVRVLPCLK